MDFKSFGEGVVNCVLWIANILVEDDSMPGAIFFIISFISIVFSAIIIAKSRRTSKK